MLSFRSWSGELSQLPVLLALIGTASCGAAHSSPAAAAAQLSAMTPIEMDVAEAAFRHLFAHNESGQQSAAAFYCVELTIAKKAVPVPEDVLRRLKSSQTPVVNDDDCTVAKDSSVRSPKVAGTGLIFYLTSIDCSSKSACTATGGYYEGNLSASKNTLTLVNDGRGWVVKEDRLDSIS